VGTARICNWKCGQWVVIKWLAKLDHNKILRNRDAKNIYKYGCRFVCRWLHWARGESRYVAPGWLILAQPVTRNPDIAVVLAPNTKRAARGTTIFRVLYNIKDVGV